MTERPSFIYYQGMHVTTRSVFTSQTSGSLAGAAPSAADPILRLVLTPPRGA